MSRGSEQGEGTKPTADNQAATLGRAYPICLGEALHGEHGRQAELRRHLRGRAQRGCGTRRVSLGRRSVARRLQPALLLRQRACVSSAHVSRPSPSASASSTWRAASSDMRSSSTRVRRMASSPRSTPPSPPSPVYSPAGRRMGLPEGGVGGRVRQKSSAASVGDWRAVRPQWETGEQCGLSGRRKSLRETEEQCRETE